MALKLFHLFVEIGFILKLDGLDLLHDVLLEVHVAVVDMVGHLFHATFHFDSVGADGALGKLADNAWSVGSWFCRIPLAWTFLKAVAEVISP